MTDIVYITANDWEGVYVNGLLDYEGHSIPPCAWKNLLKYGWQGWWDYDISEDCEWLELEGSLPLTLVGFYEKAGLE